MVLKSGRGGKKRVRGRCDCGHSQSDVAGEALDPSLQDLKTEQGGSEPRNAVASGY